MNPILNEINQQYLQIQDYIDPLPGYLDQLAEQERAEYLKKSGEALQTYHLALDKLRISVARLSPHEIIEGYTQGCRLLQRNLSGYMGEQFKQAYVPIMITAIRSEHTHTAWLFLQVLAEQLGVGAASIVTEALNSEAIGIREKALLITEQLSLIEAIPKLQKMRQDPVEEIASLAEQVLQSLRSEGANRS